MFQRAIKMLTQQFIAEERFSHKRRSRGCMCWDHQAEQLENRVVLSSLVGCEQFPAEVRVASVSPAAGTTYPNLTGVWNLTASAIADGDPLGDFKGTVQISQNKGKLTGVVQLQGLPSFELKGKLDPENVLHLSGKTKFPVELSSGNFRGIRATVNIDYAQDLNSFTGQLHRTIFGHTIDASLTGNRQTG